MEHIKHLLMLFTFNDSSKEPKLAAANFCRSSSWIVTLMTDLFTVFIFSDLPKVNSVNPSSANLFLNGIYMNVMLQGGKVLSWWTCGDNGYSVFMEARKAAETAKIS
jgi:hypothetical protein